MIGPSIGASGFCNHIRQLALALQEEGVELRLDSPKNAGWEMHVSDAEYLMHTRPFDHEMTSVLIGQPNFLPFVWAENPKHTIAFVIWEGDRVPDYWIPLLKDKRTSQVWVPSNHVKNAIAETTANYAETAEEATEDCSKMIDKIHIVPHGVDLSIFNTSESQIRADTEPFTFIANKGWSQGINDRGGIQWLLKAYCEEFKPEENVLLKVKINPVYNNPNWNLNDEIIKLNLKKPHANIAVSTDLIEFKKMKDFYKGDVFVSSTMADAFGLPTMEAMACGLPAIQTNFGGQTDFVNNENGWLVDYELQEVKHDPMYEGVSWAKPNLNDLKRVMRQCFNNKDLVVKKAELAHQEAQKWTWRNSAKKAISALDKLKE